MSDTSHPCPAPGCSSRVPFERFACAYHWRGIPYPARTRLLLAWRDYPGGDDYWEARNACLRALGAPEWTPGGGQ